MQAKDFASDADKAALQAHKKHVRELRPGLQLHADDSRETQHLDARSEVTSGLRLVLLLEGSLDLSYGDRRIQMSSTTKTPSACVVSVAEPEHFGRRLRPGNYSRRVSLGLDARWLDPLCDGQQGSARTLDAFRHQHLSTLKWQLSARSVALAEQIVRPPTMEPLLQSLYLECRSLELVSETISAMHVHVAGSQDPRVEQAGVSPRDFQRLREFHAFLSSGQADAMSMDDFSRQVGMNANSLQRQFRTVYGTTIFDYLRETRLLRARQALERDGVTVGQAAMMAGYTTAANFSTAYRKRFGHTPKWARMRL